MGNTYFENKCLHNYKYTRDAKGQDGLEVKSMLDTVLVKKDILRYEQGVRAVRGIGRDLSNHHVIMCKVT